MSLAPLLEQERNDFLEEALSDRDTDGKEHVFLDTAVPQTT